MHIYIIATAIAAFFFGVVCTLIYLMYEGEEIDVNSSTDETA